MSKYITMETLTTEIVPWSRDTVIRKIKAERFPAIKSGRGYLFDTAKVDEWLKRRTVRAG